MTWEPSSPPSARGSTSAVVYEVDDHVATITLNRPHRHNAWTGAMHRGYREAMTAAEADESVRVIVVTGAAGTDGRTAFCVGADVAALEAAATRGSYDDGLGGTEPPMPDVDERFAEDFAFQLGMTTPIVAAVNGAAAGVGLAIVCFADIRIGVTGAALTTAAPALGYPAEYGLSWLLPRLVGAGVAADWLLSGRRFSTDEAAARGLFSTVHSAEAFPVEVDAVVERLARHTAPSSLRVTKAQIWHDLLHDHPASSVAESKRLIREMAGSPDFRIGTAALAERRTPEF